MARRRAERKKNPKYRYPAKQSGKSRAHQPRTETGYTPVNCPNCRERVVFIFMAYQDETPKRRAYCRHCERVIGRDIHLPLSAFAKSFLPRHWR